MNGPVLDAMVLAWRQWCTEPSFPFVSTRSKGYCINATRTGIEALRILGVRAKPASVTVLVLNAAAEQLRQAEVPVERWPAHAWSIGLGVNGEYDGGWNGHLVIDGGDFTLDLSAGVLHRPGLIAIDGPLILPALPPLGTEFRMVGEDGTVLWVHRSPQHNEWRRASGWVNRRPDVERELAARTRIALELQGGKA